MIFLDMDGVIADLIGGIKGVYGEPDRENDWNISDWYGIPEFNFWKGLDNVEFWANLEPFEHWWDFYKKLQQFGKVIICTTPSATAPSSATGKWLWMIERFGSDFRDFILMKDKYKLAKIPDAVLIDDYDRNVEDFRKNGGKAILVPRSYNKNRNVKEHPYTYVIKEMCKL